MPGKKISDYQVLEYKKRRQSRTQVAAAATVGISERSARRIEADRGLPSQEAQRHWRTRADPFEAVWEIELLPLLAANPNLNATTLFEELVRRRPGEYLPGQVRTIQRRVRIWRATHGANRIVFFAQEHPPGRQGLSDFTVCDDLRWAAEHDVILQFSDPAKPTQNAHVESLNGRVRDELLNLQCFRNLSEVRGATAAWRQDYNNVRPHSSLSNATPAAFAQTFPKHTTLQSTVA